MLRNSRVLWKHFLVNKYVDAGSKDIIRCIGSRYKSNQQLGNRNFYTTLSLSLAGGLTFYFYKTEIKKFISELNIYPVYAFKFHKEVKCGERRENLPTYTIKEVNQHDSAATGIWVAYKEGVYNITDFVKKHPGGSNKIMMGAGGIIDPFWTIFANHKKPEILELLESMRIGNLQKEDAYKHSETDFDPYALEPTRNKALKVNGKQPFCAEPPPHLLINEFLTPKDVFYVRNHLPVPIIDDENYEIELAVEDKTKKNIKLEDLKKYPKYSIISAIMCGGNRRSEMAEVKPLRGLSWDVGAVSNAKWSGARLCDVLASLGVKKEDYNHIQFEGMDLDPAGVPYGASIPISKALDPRSDVLLAYEMNDEEIPLDHGYPVRVIVPGVVGARNVKWVNRITFSKNESPSQFQQNDYKVFSPSIDWHNVDFKTAPAIQEMPVTSAICTYQKDDKVKVGKTGTIPLKGYAYSGGGNKIIRVDVSTDHGETWHVAELVAQDTTAEEGRHYAWTIWNLDLPVDKKKGPVEIWAKAVDSQCNTQPENFKNIWNLRGFQSNAYHKVKIDLV